MRFAIGLLILTVWTALAAAEPRAPVSGPAPPVAGFPAASKTPPAPLPLDEAIFKAADELFKQVAGLGPTVEIVIDPLIDGITGVETKATQDIGRRIVEIAAARHPGVRVLPFTRDNIKRAKLVFIGTFNPINNAGQPSGERDAYWICFSLVDPKKREVVARTVGRASPDGIDSTPSALFAASPVWALDKATLAYVRACQRAKVGEAVAPDYIDRLELKAILEEARAAFEGGRLDDALSLYERAEALPGGAEKTNALNGLYLTLMRAGRSSEAMNAFGRLIDVGLAQRRLGVVFLFEAGSATFVRDASISRVYPSWLERIADRTRAARICLDVIGHASRTGSERVNIKVTRARAASVRYQLLRAVPKLARRTSATGVGSREVLVGLPIDDAQTALDRRVEFQPRECVRLRNKSRRSAAPPANGSLLSQVQSSSGGGGGTS